MNLFRLGSFTLHGGAVSPWKIDCDALTSGDLDALAFMLSKILPPFGLVEGVPRGGLSIAVRLRRYATEGPLLIADDVVTSGASLEVHRANRKAIGCVIFARGPVPTWVTPLFQMPISIGKHGV